MKCRASIPVRGARGTELILSSDGPDEISLVFGDTTLVVGVEDLQDALMRVAQHPPMTFGPPMLPGMRRPGRGFFGAVPRMGEMIGMPAAVSRHEEKFEAAIESGETKQISVQMNYVFRARRLELKCEADDLFVVDIRIGAESQLAIHGEVPLAIVADMDLLLDDAVPGQNITFMVKNASKTVRKFSAILKGERL